MTEELSKCRLCNYQSDKRLMLDIFDPQSEYSVKIEEYLSIKIPSTNFQQICFHCSQTIDNFHNFATKIKAIQRIIYPEPEDPPNDAQIFEIQLYDESPPPEVIEQLPKILNIEYPPKVPTIRTRSTRKHKDIRSEIKFEELKRKSDDRAGLDTIFQLRDDAFSDDQSHRSFDFEENEEQIVKSDVLETDEEYRAMRDPDDQDIPSAEALRKIPTRLISNGSLIYKGKRLIRLLSIFYNMSCKLCSDTRFSSINHLFGHYRELHADRQPFVTCCSMELTKMPKIIWHFVKHIEPDAFKCKICDYAVSRPKFLEIHQQTHLPHSEKPLECDFCGKRFIWKNAIKNHLMNHQSDRKEFKCDICHRNYQNAGSLASHRKFNHGDEKVRKLCEICSKSFSTINSYREHLTLHREDRDKLQLKCPECDKWFKNKRCLKSHLFLHTNQDLQCEFCDYVTKREKLLKNHMVTRHSDDKSFICDHPGCDKSFKVKRALTIHRAQVHGGKSSSKKCEFCDREFPSSTNYYTHRKNIHAKELQEALERKNEEEKLKRIRVGLEKDASPKISIIESTVISEGRNDSIIITVPSDAFGS